VPCGAFGRKEEPKLIGIKVLGLGSRLLDTPQWVVSYDPDAGRTEYPTGDLLTDEDPAKAKRFQSKAEAIKFTRQQSKNVPYRPDGYPNRPLTAFTVEITEITDG
jgi:hypothetical protein